MKKGEINEYKLSFIACVLILGLSFFSCEEYLDKAPEANYTDKDVFGNFKSFQGWIEDCYACVISFGLSGGGPKVQYADESLWCAGPLPFDLGDYWDQSVWLYGTEVLTAPNDNTVMYQHLWPNAWYSIRKANVALSKLDFMIDATQEEKDLIKGQALFFRGYFYFQLMQWWGGMPYLERPMEATDEFNLPRISYRECSLKAAADLRAAADLLPLDWDQTTVGKVTLGNNRQRASKIMALSFLGKVLLYAASPMMNEESTGKTGYDAELCKQAAEALAETINATELPGSIFKLESWGTWTDNFWVDSPGKNKMSGGTEAIMLPTVKGPTSVRYFFPYNFTIYGMGGTWSVETPTHNFVKSYYMANGLPITDPASGYDPNDPWVNREPRFYKDITIDGEKLVNSSLAGPDQYAQLYKGGRHRGGSTGSPTGYAMKRWTPQGCNQWDNRWNNWLAFIPHMRVAEVYLNYAEAVVNGYGTPQSNVPGCITAVEAVNVIRNRAQLPDLTSTYTASEDAFMADLRQERQVELAWDTNRFHDLRRWNLNTVYLDKTAIDFDRGSDGKPKNIVERVVVKRIAEKKHNWLPLQVSLTKMYKGFYQNPGW
jgi:hypothetical protein